MENKRLCELLQRLKMYDYGIMVLPSRQMDASSVRRLVRDSAEPSRLSWPQL